MYEEFYHFKENPFNATSDPVFFFSSTCHAQAFSHLTYGIEHRKGILLITGEVGTGKTTLCRTILDKYRNHKEYNVKTALILNPSFSDQQLLQMILRDFGIQGDFENKFDLVNALNEFLLEETGKGNNIVLLIDEAQNLGVGQLEQIRLLSNLETEKEKLLQIILIGQPELCAKLELASLRQLNQRIAVRYHLLPLEREEIEKYINHRLRIVSSKKSDNSISFTSEAIDIIYENCKGTPRMINIICDRALLAGYSMETFVIDSEIINRCINEVGIKINDRPHMVRSPQKNLEPEKSIVDSIINRKVWYKNIYVLIIIIFAIVGPLYAVLDFFGQTTLPKPEDQNLSVLSDATGRSGLPEQKNELPTTASGYVETVVEEYTKGSSFYGQGKYKEAAKWFGKAAKQGHAQAQSDLGVMYSEGWGVEKNYNESVEWSRKAAEQGYAQAQTNLCIMYSEGNGVEQDYNMAAKWCRKAAEQGNGQAQAILGIMYSQGHGVEQDAEEAVKWYKKASEQGIVYAREALNRLELDQE